MPVGIGMWRIDQGFRAVQFTPLDEEKRLEDILTEHSEVLGLDLLVLGRQVPTDFGGLIDLLCIDAEGELHVVELKRDRTPRDVVAQVLDYGSWVQDLSYDEVVVIFEEHHPGEALEATFTERFGSSPPETLNESHQLIIVASELDSSTERIVGYLSETYSVPVNAIFFRHFADGSAEYLTRSWLIDPTEADTRSGPTTRKREPWNGRDFYVSFGEGEHRRWADARRYGFVSGGGKPWHIKTLYSLFPGARVFVNIPGTGYVGVGTVVEEAKPISEFVVEVGGEQVPILEAGLTAPKVREFVGDSETEETLVRVDWVETLDAPDAIWEPGMFANQNTACRLRNRFTLERLIERFRLSDLGHLAKEVSAEEWERDEAELDALGDGIAGRVVGPD